MRLLRVIIRGSALTLLAVTVYALWLAGKLLTVAWPHGRRRWRRLVLRNGARLTARIIGMRIAASGVPPQPPFFLVANHLSYIDIIAFATQCDCVFVAKREVAGWPLLGQLARSVGTIFIARRNPQDLPRVIGLIDQALYDGLGVIVFPEGTSTMGDRVLPFNPALLEPAARAHYPVSYATISYATPHAAPPAHLAVCWWGAMTFLPHVGALLQLPGFDAFINFGAHAICSDDRKLLAQSLWRAVNEQFIPVVAPAAANSLRGKKEA